MLRENIKNIISNYLNNQASEEEVDQLLLWIEDADNLKEFNEYLMVNHYLNSSFNEFNALKAYNKSTSKEKKKKKYTFFKYAVAASVVMLISLSVVFTKNNTIEETPLPIVAESMVVIGTDKAILTLENGESVSLEKGANYSNSNIKSNGEELVYAAKKGKTKLVYNYLSVPRGGQFVIKLSDGTKVWMNSESKIKYPKSFIEGESRKVELLYGEAYFDVSPSTSHKGANFKVVTGAQEVVVLGTEFNVKAYKGEEAIYTTLVEGSVLVGKNSEKLKIKPGEQSVVNSVDNNIKVKKINTALETSWRQGLFVFDKKSLAEMMNVLSRCYDVDVVFEDESKKKIVFTGFLKRKDSVNQLLESLKKTGEFDYKIKNNTIIIK